METHTLNNAGSVWLTFVHSAGINVFDCELSDIKLITPELVIPACVKNASPESASVSVELADVIFKTLPAFETVTPVTAVPDPPAATGSASPFVI